MTRLPYIDELLWQIIISLTKIFTLQLGYVSRLWRVMSNSNSAPASPPLRDAPWDLRPVN